MSDSKNVLAISIDGVIRDLFEQFDNVYRKKFIKNPGLVGMNEKYEYVPDEDEEDEFKRLETKANALIHLPMTTYSLMNHYEFESVDVFNKFMFQDHALELFGSAGQVPFSMENANKLYVIKSELGLDEVILFCPGEQQTITATLHFCVRNGCKIGHIIFDTNPLNIWNHANIVITENPNIIDAKPKDGRVIKINKEYNINNTADLNLDDLKKISYRMLENFIKNNKYE